MRKDNKRIIGIVLLVIGILGLFGVPSSDDKGALIAGSLVFIAIGGVLLFLSVKAKKNTPSNLSKPVEPAKTAEPITTIEKTAVDGSKPVDLLPLYQQDFIKVYEYTKPLCTVYEDENPLPYIQDKANANQRQLTFSFEPDNPEDKKAIAVLLDGKKIGYVYRGQTQDMIHDYYEKKFEVCAHICTFTDEEITYKIGFYKPKDQCRQKIVSFKNKKFTENAIEGDIYSVYYDEVDERYMISIYGEEISIPKSAAQYARQEYEVPAEVGENCESLIFYK